MLNSDDTYIPLSGNPTSLYQIEIRKSLAEGVRTGVLTSLAEKLFVDCPLTPVFHSLPKIHKECFPPPLRPIGAGIWVNE